MGPSRAREQKLTQDELKALLREKDDRIATLETRLEAYSARASTTHTRLLKTIDVLDALRSQHSLENSAEEQAKMKLVHEVDRWRTVAKTLEVEKDELKDVVEDLIEKEQVAAGALNGEGTKDHYNYDLLAYATSIIARLGTELDLERQSHRRTVEEANLRIEELEAMVAVREAELESCITSLGDHENQPEEPQGVSTRAFEKQKLNKRLAEPKPLSDEECARFLESNSARNRSLELEIRHIAQRLEQARIAASSSSGPRKEPQPPTPRNGHEAIPTPSPRTRSASVDPNDLSYGKVTPTPAPAPSSMMLSIAQLDNHIRTMTTQMDALVSERTTLIEAAARQRRVTDGINIDTFQDILRVEGECVQLQAEVDDLREQLQHARTFARDREKALLREIAQLRASLSGPSALHPLHDPHHFFSPQPLEDDVALEESMELASPLIPTSASNPFPDPPFPDPDMKVDLVSFPFPPNHVSSPAPDAPPTPPRTTRRSPSPQEIERVQAALDVARTRLAQKEEALSQLRAELQRLQLEVQAQTRRDGDGDGD